MGAKGPTLHQVANRAGVSIATVSRVARGLQGVSAETRELVTRTIQDLNYRPNPAGRALVRRWQDTLGIVFPSLQGSHFPDIIHGFEFEATAAGMSVLILGTDCEPGTGSPVQGFADRADGLAIVGGTVSDEEVRRLAGRGMPLVTMSRAPLAGIANVRAGTFDSSQALTTHLIRDHGYRRLAFAGTTTASSGWSERWAGFAQAQTDAGLAPPDAPRYPASDQRTGFTAIQAVLRQDTLPEAIVCASDEIAIGMMSALASAGVQVPDQVAITGWGNIVHSEFTIPPLTTVTHPARTLGREAARILLDLIRRREPPATHTVLSTETVLRASCGCPYQPDHAVVHIDC